MVFIEGENAIGIIEIAIWDNRKSERNEKYRTASKGLLLARKSSISCLKGRILLIRESVGRP